MWTLYIHLSFVYICYRFTWDKGKLIKVIATIIRRKFDGPFYTWKKTPIDKQEIYFRTFAQKYNWEAGITELVKAEFIKICKKRMRGIVSQAKNGTDRPIWIGEKLWEHMWQYWDIYEAVDKSSSASRSHNYDRGGLGIYKHVGGPKSFLQIQQEMEEEYGRLVSWAEVFLRTHTRKDGTFIDLKAKNIVEVYKKTIADVMEQQAGDGPDNSDKSSDVSTQMNITIEEKNVIFLRRTETDPKGNPFGLGRIGETITDGRRKECYPEVAITPEDVIKKKEQLEEQRKKIEPHDTENA